ncbi:hypothetical protein [Sinorhizobium medicae]|uniref:hypothetical protein n=1 Tax=Sinorhizobium medicae TaxID=110321 RepID=UPI0012980A31|nr:hypothetical protein [Sinorhizobium medicae]MQX45742.1 hypothetical protein [Sinorhizobium medicae]
MTKWVKTEGCPSVRRAGKPVGLDWIIDISEVVRCLQERAAADAVQKFGLPEDGQMTEAEAERCTAVAKAIVNMVEAAEVQHPHRIR